MQKKIIKKCMREKRLAKLGAQKKSLQVKE